MVVMVVVVEIGLQGESHDGSGLRDHLVLVLWLLLWMVLLLLWWYGWFAVGWLFWSWIYWWRDVGAVVGSLLG